MHFDIETPLSTLQWYILPVLIGDISIFGLAVKPTKAEDGSFRRMGKMWSAMRAPRPLKSGDNRPIAISESSECDSDMSSEYVEETELKRPLQRGG